jgi:DNA repair protein RadC
MTNSTHGRQRRRVNDLPEEERPLTRLLHYGAAMLSNTELIAAVLQTADALDLAQDILAAAGNVRHIERQAAQLVAAVAGLSIGELARLLAAIELGRRTMTTAVSERPKVTGPATAAGLLMADMMRLEREEMRVILLDTRNHVTAVHMVASGNVNTIAIRLAEVFRPAVQQNAVALILAHNHPSGDPTPSPEDVAVTRAAVKSGKELGITVLDHVIIGDNCFCSLKERGLGFDEW